MYLSFSRSKSPITRAYTYTVVVSLLLYTNHVY